MSSLQTVILNIYNIFCKINSFRNDFNSLCSTSIYLFVLLEIEFFNFGKKLQLLHARVQSVGICPFRGYFIPILFKSADYYYNKLSLSPPMFLIFRCPWNACTYPDHKIYFNDKIVPSYIRFQSGIEFQILKKLNFIMKRLLNLRMYFQFGPFLKWNNCLWTFQPAHNCEKFRDSWVEHGTKLKISLKI